VGGGERVDYLRKGEHQMGLFTVVQISDMHLDLHHGQCKVDFDEIRARVDAEGPDLVIVTGDVSADGHIHAGVFDRVKSQLDLFSAPVHVIPGNHDVGDKRGEKHEVKPEYLEKWKATFKSDRFHVRRDGWSLIGINTQVLGSSFHEEVEQFAWLDEILAAAESRHEQVAIFLHAAPYLNKPNETLCGPSQYWGFDPIPRGELLERLGRPVVKLVGNGHLHWHRIIERNSVIHVWCPSTSFVVDDAIFPDGGAVVGFVKYEFNVNGVTSKLISLDTNPKTVVAFRRTVDLPGRAPMTLARLVLDMNGTTSRDGNLLPGVADRIRDLATRIRITVLTADTFGLAESSWANLPVHVEIIKTGDDKRKRIEELGAESLVAIGNGRNDVEMVKAAAIGIAVIGPEGASGELLRSADVVTNNIDEALDLVAKPVRLKATLRD